MSYIGQQPVVGRYILLDQISGGFNGTASGFTMTAGGQGVLPGLAQNVLLSLGGVIQQPGVDYTISGSGLTFTTPPTSGTTFFATVLGDMQAVGTPSDGTVIPASIASSGTFVFPNVTVSGVTTIASGSAAAPSLSISGDANTGLYSPSADQISITTSGTERFRIDNNGQLEAVSLGTAAAPTFSFTTDPNTGIYSPGADQLSITTSGVERLQIDSSGRLLLGPSSARTNLYNGIGTARNQVESTSSSAAEYIGVRNTNDALGPLFIFCKSRGTTFGSNTIVQANDFHGSISFQGNDGTNFIESSRIYATGDGSAPGVNNVPGQLIFMTRAAGAGSPSARLLITSDGSLRLLNSPGIDFSQIQTNAAGMTSETLDSYEEGTFTPTIIGTTTAGTGTYTVQTGFYTKVGNLVNFTVFLNWTAHTGTGNIAISGLPFVSSNSTNIRFTASIYPILLALTAGNTALALITQNTADIAITQVPTGGGSVSAVPMDTSASVIVTGAYRVP